MGSLTCNSVILTIPDDFDWPNEFSWAEVEQKKTYSLTGALILESGKKQTGRPITLSSDGTSAWMKRSDMSILRDFVAQPGAVMSLFVRGQFLTVVFDHEAGAMEATQVLDYSDPEGDDAYYVTLRFLEVPT